MNVIELQYSEYVGAELVVRQRPADEVFAELKQRLESIGYLPDEYFLLDKDWENGRLIPLDADICCETDYGGNEGIYLDVYLTWREEGTDEQRAHYITGKTLGESGTDLDRMFLTAAAITKAFHGENAQHARYVLTGGKEQQDSLVVGLTPDERRIFIESLIERRERMGTELREIECLLRRLTGSVTDYIDTVGHRPLDLDEHDRAMLAIRDGAWESFRDIYPRLTDRKEKLLLEAAGRTGMVGRRMMAHILAELENISQKTYAEVCRRAVDSCDSNRVQLLMEQAESHVTGLEPSFYGNVIYYAVSERKSMAIELVQRSRSEWIKDAPTVLLYYAVSAKRLDIAALLVEKGLSPGNRLADIVRCLIVERREWELGSLLDYGMIVERDNYRALDECVTYQALGAAKQLIERGADFDGYCAWVRLQRYNGEKKKIPFELKEYAAELAAQKAQEEAAHEQAG